ncbi:universal stress protein [Arthrobacter burdickii]|uniref:Universal stress protein n=1 Tax=Arthrobacter burdickii TaxID=3035920 RepID=A0ABT8JZ49_9MICC|nr:universal stress protein [Arthrobacter burdickii]MDN4609871.1 universal stress protein [Arthrobacter burdickii]
MPHPVVVGVDGSETAYKAAEVARDLAVALNAPLLVISAFDGDHHEVIRSGNDEFVISATRDAEKVAKGVAGNLRTNGLEVTHLVARGKPADTLISEAARTKARLIVVGNRRMRGIGRVLGSVASSVAHGASCDVYIANTYDADK